MGGGFGLNSGWLAGWLAGGAIGTYRGSISPSTPLVCVRACFPLDVCAERANGFTLTAWRAAVGCRKTIIG